MHVTTSKAAAATASQLRGCTNRRVRQFARHLGRFYDARLAGCGLKTTQYSLLATLARLEPVQQGELARALSMDPSTVTRNLRPLRAAGWISIGPGPDARTRLLTLSDNGRLKCDEARAYWKRAQQMLNRALGAGRVARLHALIDACQTTLDRLDQEGDPAG
ncbi:MAG: MarR family winged helix-turn-helix transcriptional regulator [Burkholderiaceae bacterium]|nr:MarR family winged helix-turn-helix transcriptional regulator [Burkholderiaceae bacterium]